MENKIILLEKSIEDLKIKNNNLLRIMRERANQARGLRRKKEHDGYVLLSCAQWKEKFNKEIWSEDVNADDYSDDTQRDYALQTGLLIIQSEVTICWKSILQTPYDSNIKYHDICDTVENDLKEHILKRLGCIAMTDCNDDYQACCDSDGKDISTLYRWYFTANHRSKLWELQLFTTDCLSEQ